MKELTKKQREEIKKSFLEYKKIHFLTTKEIAERLGLDHTTIQKYFVRYFGNEYKSLVNAKKRKLSKDTIRMAFEEYKKPDMNASSLAKRIGIDENTIGRYFKKIYGKEYEKLSKMKMTGRGRKRLTKEEVEAIFEEYKNNPNITKKDLARKFEVNGRTIWRRLKLQYGKRIREISLKKCGWNRKLTDKEIRDVFVEYKNGIPLLELSKKYSVTRDSLAHRMPKVIGLEYKEIASRRGLEDAGRKRQKVSDKDIVKLFEIYKKSNININDLAEKIKLAENSLIARFKRLFGEEYKKIARKRRDERKITKKDCIEAFERYRTTNISLTQLSDELGMATSSLSPRFRKLFGSEYLRITQKKMDLVEVNKKGKIAEKIALEYLKCDGARIRDVRRLCIIKGSLKKPDFIFDNTFVEVKSHYVTVEGFGRLKGYKNIINDYMGKEIVGQNQTILTKGIIISLSGFSPEVRKMALKDNIHLIGPDGLRKVFINHDKKELLELLEEFRTDYKEK